MVNVITLPHVSLMLVHIDELGLMTGSDRIRLLAGDIKSGLRLWINGKEIMVANNKHTLASGVTIKFTQSRRVVIKTDQLVFTISQSDKFFNIDTRIVDQVLLSAGEKRIVTTQKSVALPSSVPASQNIHGLIGQTWRNIEYSHDREYAGDVADYMLNDGLWGHEFVYNLYH